MSFQIEVGGNGDATLLVASGELDLATVDRFETAIDEAVTSGSKRLVIDLTGLSFMDSTGMRALLLAQQRMDDSEGSMGVVLAGGPIARALGVVGIDRLLKMFDSVEAAIA